jgi:hypothetical protein
MKNKVFIISCLRKMLVAVMIIFVPHSVMGAQSPSTDSVCNQNDTWVMCAFKVKKAIKATNDPNAALSAASEWAERYSKLYESNARKGWTPTDQQMLEKAMGKLWHESIGQYLDPAGLALSLGLIRYFPKLAATLEFAGGPYVTIFIGILAPTPIANDFTSASFDNKQINEILAQKLPVMSIITIRERYPELFRQGFEIVKGQKTLP